VDAGAFGVFVKHLESGATASVNADRPFYAASIFKLMVMYEVFSQSSRGLLDLEERLVVTPYYDDFGMSPRATGLCQEMSVRHLLHAMMSVSDNAAGVLLLDLVGSWNVNASMEALGLEASRILPEDLPVTASDLGLLLEAMVRGEAVSRSASEAMLSLLATETFDNGIVAGVPAGTVVVHKNGVLANASNQAAIVYSPNATYVLVVLSERNRETRLIRAVSEAVYGYFNARR
jgi:beta-lactamase class A